MQKKNIGKILDLDFKGFKLQKFTDQENKNLIIKRNQINFVKNQKKIMSFTFV